MSEASRVSEIARFPDPRLRRASSAEQVASAVRHQILTGQLVHGDRLTQDEIAAQLGLSRIPVREAMIALDREGWVTFEPSRGAFVTGLGADDVRDHYELRGMILGLLVERATALLDDDGRREVADRAKAVRTAVDVDAFATANDRVLRHLIRTAGSTRFTAALRVMPAIVPGNFFAHVAAARPIQEKGIAEVARAAMKGDAAKAGGAMRRVVQRQGAAVVEEFDHRGLLSDHDAPGPIDWPRGGRPTSAGRVAAHVRELIFRGQLDEGQRLPQDDIADAIGVSRIPVREAIIALEREGWLRVEPHRGAYVQALDEAAVVDHFTLFGSYFGFAAKRAIERRPRPVPADDHLASRATAVATARTAPAMEAANTRYLQALLTAAASSRLEVVLRSMPQLVPGHFFATVPGSIKAQREGIPTMQAAIDRRDAKAAAAAALDLQLEQAKHVAKVVARQAGPR